jgi:hypothetical protein
VPEVHLAKIFGAEALWDVARAWGLHQEICVDIFALDIPSILLETFVLFRLGQRRGRLAAIKKVIEILLSQID